MCCGCTVVHIAEAVSVFIADQPFVLGTRQPTSRAIPRREAEWRRTVRLARARPPSAGSPPTLADLRFHRESASHGYRLNVRLLRAFAARLARRAVWEVPRPFRAFFTPRLLMPRTFTAPTPPPQPPTPGLVLEGGGRAVMFPGPDGCVHPGPGALLSGGRGAGTGVM